MEKSLQSLYGPFLDHRDFLINLPAVMKIIETVLLPAEIEG